MPDRVRQLPDFPWDSLAALKQRASAFSDPSLGPDAGRGLVDLSVGTPVDPTPAVVREALAAASDAHGYPLTWGTADLREAVAAWFAARRGVPDVDPAGVLPTIGSKELVAWLPILMGLGAGDVVAFPRVAYPTYDVGARLAGATPVAVDALTALGPLTGATTPKLLWLNTPANPTGKVLGIEHLAKVVSWARQHGVVVASDECYAELDWRPRHAGSRRTADDTVDPRPAGDRRLARGAALRLLAVEAVEPRGLPRCVRRGGPGPRRPAPRGAQARRDDGALAGAAGGAGRARGRRARRGAEGPVCRPPGGAAAGRSAASACGSTTRRRGSTSGPPPARTGGRRSSGWRRAASSPLPATSTGRQADEHVRIALTATDERVEAAVRRLA